MKRRRIPGTPRRSALFVLPEIRDDWSTELKNGLALRNACALEGACPDCGAIGELHSEEGEVDGVEVFCPECAREEFPEAFG